MTEYETFTHAGLTVELWSEDYIDENDNPRTNQDGNVGVMFCDYSGYNLGDEDAPDPRDKTVTCDQCGGSGELADQYEILDVRAYGRENVADTFPSLDSANRYIREHAPEGATWVVQLKECPKCNGLGDVDAGLVEYLKREHGARVILPLFVYEHGGITMSAGGRLDKGEDDFDRNGRYASDPGAWDTSSVGVIFDTTESREACGIDGTVTDESLEAQLGDEVKYYAAYLEGNVFGYTIKDEDGETLESCGGFLELNPWADDAYVKVQAKESAECCAERVAAEKREAYEMACRDVVTV